MPKKKMLSAFDLQIDNQKLKSCFNFQKDLALGQASEEYIKSIFADKTVKIEVKKDDWATRSGNIAIEFESRGKPSGIEVTKADFWCHIVGHYFILVFPIDFLRKLTASLKSDSKYVKSLGDRNASGNPVAKAILIPWIDLLNRFKDYKPNE